MAGQGSAGQGRQGQARPGADYCEFVASLIDFTLQALQAASETAVWRGGGTPFRFLGAMGLAVSQSHTRCCAAWTGRAASKLYLYDPSQRVGEPGPGRWLRRLHV